MFMNMKQMQAKGGVSLINAITYPTETDHLVELIKAGARGALNDIDIIKIEISEWRQSQQRAMMLTGDQYYLNHTDIQQKERKWADGVILPHKSNLKLEHAVYRKLVDQKTGYLLSKSPTVATDNVNYGEALSEIMDRAFWKLIKTAGREAINKGIAWLHVFYDLSGRLRFRMIPSEEIIPLWADNAHTELQGLIRVYDIYVYDGMNKRIQTNVEYWTTKGVRYLTLDGKDLIDNIDVVGPNGEAINYHVLMDGQPYTWDRIPFIPIRYNDVEQPLIDIVKSLIDNLNMQVSVNADLLADLPSAFLLLIGYGGQDLAEFVRDLKQANAVKLDQGGDLRHEVIEPATQALTAMLEQTRKDLYEYGRGVDTQNENFGASSGVALKFRYADLDMDCNIFENEIQSSFEQIIWFINQHLININSGDFSNESVNLILNRDVIFVEADVIKACQDSAGVLSKRTILQNHPWVDDVEEELERIEEETAEQQKQLDLYGGFGGNPANPAGAGAAGGGAVV
jgi:SPP1 family phage portal protein